MQKALYIQTAFVGDLLLSIPTLNWLKKNNYEVDLVCRKGIGGVLQELGLVENLFEMDKSKKKSLINTQFLKNKYDLLLCPHESFRSTILSGRVNANVKVGYRSLFKKWIYDKTLQRPMAYPEAMRQLSLLTFFSEEISSFFSQNSTNWKEVNKSNKIPEFASMDMSHFLQDKNEQFVNQLFERGVGEKVVFLAPGSVWNTKRWGKEYYLKVAQALIEKECQVVIIGAPNEIEIADFIFQSCPEAINLCGQTSLFELLNLMSFGHAIVCNDSGAMHLAAVANLPIVSLFGPTTLDLGYRPWSNKATVIEKGLSCRPCGKHGGEICPIGTHECMTLIQPQTVLAAVDKALDDSQKN